MLLVWLLCAWVAASSAQNPPAYQAISLYAVPECKGTPETYVATKKATCTPIACSTFQTLSLQTTCSQGSLVFCSFSLERANASCQANPFFLLGALP